MNMKPDDKKELKKKIADLEQSLTSLRDKLSEQDETEKHKAIDELDKYIDEINHKYSNLHEFWVILGKELRGLFKSGEEKQDESEDDEIT